MITWNESTTVLPSRLFVAHSAISLIGGTPKLTRVERWGNTGWSTRTGSSSIEASSGWRSSHSGTPLSYRCWSLFVWRSESNAAERFRRRWRFSFGTERNFSWSSNRRQCSSGPWPMNIFFPTWPVTFPASHLQTISYEISVMVVCTEWEFRLDWQCWFLLKFRFVRSWL